MKILKGALVVIAAMLMGWMIAQIATFMANDIESLADRRHLHDELVEQEATITALEAQILTLGQTPVATGSTPAQREHQLFVPQGLPGRDGKDGADGEARDGVDGTNGVDGSPGAPGAPGKDGVNGRDGRGIVTIECVEGTMVVTYTDDTTQQVGYCLTVPPQEIP